MRILLILLLFPTIVNSQIIIDQAGDNWRELADSAVRLIKSTSDYHYSILQKNCERITFFTDTCSSTSGEVGEKGTIYISRNDIKLGIQNIAVAIVHESFHCKITRENRAYYFIGVERFNISDNDEELCAYRFELSFLKKLPNPEPILIRHAETQINKLSK